MPGAGKRKGQEMTEAAAYKKMYKWMTDSAFMPFVLENNELANRLCEDAKAKYPKAVIYTSGVVAYICLTEQARAFLLKQQQKRTEDLKQELKDAKKIISILQKGGGST